MSEGVKDPQKRKTLRLFGKIGRLALIGTAATAAGVVATVDMKDPVAGVEPNLDGFRKLLDQFYNSKNREEGFNNLYLMITLMGKKDFKLPNGFQIQINCLTADNPFTTYTATDFNVNSVGQKKTTFYKSGSNQADVRTGGFGFTMQRIDKANIYNIGVNINSAILPHSGEIPKFLSLPKNQTVNQYSHAEGASVSYASAIGESYNQSKSNSFNFYSDFSTIYTVDKLVSNQNSNFSVTRFIPQPTTDSISEQEFNYLTQGIQ